MRIAYICGPVTAMERVKKRPLWGAMEGNKGAPELVVRLH